MNKLTLAAILMLVAGASFADDYQVEWVPGGATIRDISPQKPSAADVSLATAILALQLQLANAPRVKRVVDVALYGNCGVYTAAVVSYSDGDVNVINVTSSHETIDFDLLSQFHKKWPVVHLASNACN